MRKSFLALALTLGAVSLRADIITTFVVNTSSLAGTNGYVDFQFNPGVFATQAASVTVKNFSGATYIAGSQTDTGSASGGPLPGTVTLNNTALYNDDNEGVKFGNLLVFTLDFSGPAVSSPNNSPSGSSFAFSIFDSTDTNPLLTTDPNGFAAVVNLKPNGTYSVSTPSSAVTLTPEPASAALLLLSAALLGGTAYRKKRLP